jgi:hypothetical protein
MSLELFSTSVAATTGTIQEEQLWSCNATTAAFALTLPDATRCKLGKFSAFKNDASANAVTVTCAGAQKILTIGGLVSTFALAAQGNSVTLVSDGAQWLLTAKI